jgi:hypothetical protein
LNNIVNISKLSHDIRIAVLDEHENKFLKWADKQWNSFKNGFYSIIGSGNKDLTYDEIQRKNKNRNKVYEIIRRFNKEL